MDKSLLPLSRLTPAIAKTTQERARNIHPSQTRIGAFKNP